MKKKYFVHSKYPMSQEMNLFANADPKLNDTTSDRGTGKVGRTLENLMPLSQ